MKVITYLQKREELEELRSTGVKEVILSHRQLASLGKLNSDVLLSLATLAHREGMDVALEWDLLVEEGRFDDQFSLVGQLLKEGKEIIDAVRVRDLGAARRLSIEFPEVELHYLCSPGNHNLKSLLTLERSIGGPLKRLVLSPELTQESIFHYNRELNSELELLLLGRIPLFTTPRKLLSPHFNRESEQQVEVRGESEESPHRGFPVVENSRGTTMYHIKDHCLYEHLGALKEEGLSVLRVDIRHLSDLQPLNDLRDLMDDFSKSHALECRKRYPLDTTRGYFPTNKSDVLFVKLKNHRIQRRDPDYIGDVVDAVRGSHLAVMVRSERNALKQGSKIRIVTPDGKEVVAFISRLEDSSHQPIKQRDRGELGLINGVKGVTVRSAIYLCAE